MPRFPQLNGIYIMLDLTPTKIGEDVGGSPGVIPKITVFENKLVSTTESFYNINANDYAEASADNKELLIKDGWKIKFVEYPGVTSEGGTAYKPGSTFDTVGTLLGTYITLVPSTPRKSVDLTTLPGWSSLSDGSHNITIAAKADGYRDSEPSAAVQVEKAVARNSK